MNCGCPYVTNEKQPVIADTFGPFHDETILAGVDKMLYFIGSSMLSPSLLQLGSVIQRHMATGDFEEIAKKLSTQSIADIGNLIQKQISSSNIGATNSDADACKPKEKAPTDKKMNTPSSLSALASHPASVRFVQTVVQRHLCPKCGCKQTPKTNARLSSFLKKFDTSAPTCRRSKKSPLKRSFSLCSLACRSLKEKFSNFQKIKNSQWFCTRRRNESQHQIFEIYQNTKRKMQSTQSLANENPKMILIITPCGTVFPFETVSCHF